MTNASRDQNRVTTLLGVSATDGVTPVPIYADSVTHRLYVTSNVSASFQTDTFTSTNGQTTFTASQTPLYTIYLSVNGSIQRPSTNYTVSGSNAVLTSGVPSGVDVVWVYVI